MLSYEKILPVKTVQGYAKSGPALQWLLKNYLQQKALLHLGLCTSFAYFHKQNPFYADVEL